MVELDLHAEFFGNIDKFSEIPVNFKRFSCWYSSKLWKNMKILAKRHENTTTSRTTRLVFSNTSTTVNILDNQTFCFVYEAYKYTESEGAIEMPYYVVISENVNGFQCAVASCVGSIIMSVLRRCFSIHPCIYNIRSYCIHS